MPLECHGVASLTDTQAIDHRIEVPFLTAEPIVHRAGCCHKGNNASTHTGYHFPTLQSRSGILYIESVAPKREAYI